MRRRGFLLGALGMGGSALWRLGGWPALPGPSTSPGERLRGLLAHEDSARLIGRAYLRVAPTEARPDVLTALVAERLPGGRRALDDAGGDDLRELVARGTARDFAEERTVVVDGWVLSCTEARLCALAALS